MRTKPEVERRRMELEADQTERLLERGAKLLRRGRPHEASLVYGRILLRDPGPPRRPRGPGARRRRPWPSASARPATRLDRAAEALGEGDGDGGPPARPPGAAAKAADPERAHDLLDRLDGPIRPHPRDPEGVDRGLGRRTAPSALLLLVAPGARVPLGGDPRPRRGLRRIELRPSRRPPRGAAGAGVGGAGGGQ